MTRPAKETDAFQTAEKDIQARIDEYYKRGWIKNSANGDNDLACDLFTHPQNYIPVLEKFPSLKICIAHMGGIGEFQMNEDLYNTNWLGINKLQSQFKELAKIREVDTVRWLDRLREMMQHYPSLFTDVSYTVSYFDQDLMVKRLTEFAETLDESDTKLGHRILFGTDFFMTEQEKKEADLYGLIKNTEALQGWLDGFCRENVERYVRF
jgi:predicted TIM-barrel fold metal-dependent hydrolase